MGSPKTEPRPDSEQPVVSGDAIATIRTSIDGLCSVLDEYHVKAARLSARVDEVDEAMHSLRDTVANQSDALQDVDKVAKEAWARLGRWDEDHERE